MRYPARPNKSAVASCKLPAGNPNFNSVDIIKKTVVSEFREPLTVEPKRRVGTAHQNCLPTTAYRLLPTDYCLPTTDYCLPTTAYRLPTTAYRLPTTAINLLRIKHPFPHHRKSLRRDLPKEATPIPFVARRPADLLYAKQDRVEVAIQINAPHLLHVAAFLPLAPELAAAAAEVNRPARGQRLGIRLGVHVGHHQHGPVVGVLGNRRQKPAAFRKIGSRVGGG